MDRLPVTSWQQRLLYTYVKTCDSLPVNQIGQMMKNLGILPGLTPTTPTELCEAVITHGNVAFVMLRRLLPRVGCYELSLNLRQEREMFMWVWLCPCGDIFKKSTEQYKYEDECLKKGNKRKPAHVNLCLESIPCPSNVPYFILV